MPTGDLNSISWQSLKFLLGIDGGDPNSSVQPEAAGLSILLHEIQKKTRTIFELVQPREEIQNDILPRIVKSTTELITAMRWYEPRYLHGNSSSEEARWPGRCDSAPLSPEKKEHLAFAAACYLLRAHALFYGRPRRLRNFNAAKTSLNDLFRAYQLTWRLYHCLPNNHREVKTGLASYLESVKSGDDDKAPGESSYFVWSLFLLNDIIRGEIYRKIDHVSAADRHFRRTHNRFHKIEHLFSDARTYPDARFVTPRLWMALLERSELHYDMGRILESLQLQIHCLTFIVQPCGPDKLRSQLGSNFVNFIVQNNNVNWFRNHLATIGNFLEAEQSLAVIRRDYIAKLFGYYVDNPADGPSTPLLIIPLPIVIAHSIDKHWAMFATETLARIGFTLYTIRPDSKKHQSPEYRNWLRDYFRFDLLWQSPKGLWMRTSCRLRILDTIATRYFRTRRILNNRLGASMNRRKAERRIPPSPDETDYPQCSRGAWSGSIFMKCGV